MTIQDSKKYIDKEEYYSIKEKEMIVRNCPKQPLSTYFKYAVWGLLAFLVISSILISLFFHDNFIFNFDIKFYLMVLVSFISSLFIKKKKMPVESDMELRLYDDKLVLYRPKIKYSKRMIRREINTVYFTDLERIVYKKDNNRCYIYGNVIFEWNRFNNDIMQDIPYRNKKINKTLLFFNTHYINMDNFIKKVSENSRIRIEIE